MDEGGAQGPGQPNIGLCLRDAEHRSPLQEGRSTRLPVGPSRPNYGLEDLFLVLLGHLTPRGHLPVYPVPPEEHGVEQPLPLVP